MKKRHPFTHLGPAPYKVVAYVYVSITERGTTIQGPSELVDGQVGTCHHCGTGILHNYIIQDGIGQHHAIGSDCAMKTDSEIENLSAIERTKKIISKAKRKQNELRKRDALFNEIKKLVEDNKAELQKNENAFAYVLSRISPSPFKTKAPTLGSLKFLKIFIEKKLNQPTKGIK